MNARKYRVKVNLSPLDIPPLKGLGEQKDFTQTEPPIIISGKLQLKITKKLLLIETYLNKEHEILSMQSIYEIPINEIKNRENIYECFKDATLGLSEAYNFVKNQVDLPKILFPIPPIENYQREIDGVFYLLNSLN